MTRPVIRYDNDGDPNVIVPKPYSLSLYRTPAYDWPDRWPERPETHNAYGLLDLGTAWFAATHLVRRQEAPQ